VTAAAAGDAPAVARVDLRPGRDKAVSRGHPWVFSGAVAREEGPAAAPVARVVTADGRDLGLGFYGPRSRIRVRLLGAGVAAADRDFFAARLAAAAELRRSLLPPATTGYRLLNAEGDGLPGWTVDRYGEVLVSQITAAGLEALRGEAYAALAALRPGAAILQRNDLAARRREGLGTGDEAIAGEPGAEAVFSECGFTFTAELAGGQKTGFYCDQRENRRRVEGLAAGRELLDLFAHSGAFGLYALRGGARRVVAVESSPRFGERARDHLRRNGLDAALLEWVEGDVFADLRRRRERYGVVVCDPPPLVLRRSDLERGSRAYKDLNRLALARVDAGGFLLTFSCSAAVDARLFRQILAAAAAEAGVRAALLAPLGPGPDHPVDLAHPEGEYLKGWLVRVSGSRG
jgi:23S rRNA (cytosine1962-C5)-methyltransferase